VSHPRDVLLGAQAASVQLPVCDHYSGVHARMLKSLQLQADMTQEFGTCVFDVTLDCEDGAPVGGEADHAVMVTEMALAAKDKSPRARIAVRVHPVDHPCFEADMAQIAGSAGRVLSHIMVPKVETVADVDRAQAALAQAHAADVPLHVLIESPAAVHRAFEIAAHPRVQSISFGLMDFVSAHAGAIPADGMGVQGQFTHPLVVRAKLEIASACHAHGKVPSHCVVTEFKSTEAIRLAAQKASRELGYTRMWSIHPDQIRPSWRPWPPAKRKWTKPARSSWPPIKRNGPPSAMQANCMTARVTAFFGN